MKIKPTSVLKCLPKSLNEILGLSGCEIETRVITKSFFLAILYFMRPEIDVIMPFHRNDNFFKQAIRSVEGSQDVSLRLIIVDDRPPLTQELDCDLIKNHVYIRTLGQGYPTALRAGLNQITSRFFGFQDSDDLSSPNRLRKQIRALDNARSDISICGLRKINKHSEPLLLQPPIMKDVTTLRESNLLGSINSNSTWVCRSKVLEDPNFMNPHFQSIDWATTLTLNPKFELTFLNERLYFYRMHSLQTTRTVEYLESAFDEIFPIWSELNQQLGLPNLDVEQARTIAAPWSQTYESQPLPVQWIKAFLKLNQIQNSMDYRKLKSIFLHRIFWSQNTQSRQRLDLIKMVLIA